MDFDYSTLELLRQNHPAWRLLCSDHAALVLSFLHRVFIEPNRRVMVQADLLEALEDELFGLRARLGQEAFPRTALAYLNDWSSPEKGWLRNFYQEDSDEPYFDLTPALEKAVTFLRALMERSFVGTESRLLTLVDLLKQMYEGTQNDPEERLKELQKKRDAIDAEIVRVQEGHVVLLDDTALKDRFQQFSALARDLLSDFREVEHNFRTLDRRVRERIALFEGSKGALLAEIMEERASIAHSDQGRSFRAFWDFLMSSTRQEALSTLLDQILKLPAIAALQSGMRIRRVHYDWLEAGEHTQRTIAKLSQQLRRFLDDRAWLENRRIMDLLHAIESKALAVRNTPPRFEGFLSMPAMAAAIDLPLERPLYRFSAKPCMTHEVVASEALEIDTQILYAQVFMDKAGLAHHIRQALETQASITLHALCQDRPLQQGLAELVAYLQLGAETFQCKVDEDRIEPIRWEALDREGQSVQRQARLARIIFVRGA